MFGKGPRARGLLSMGGGLVAAASLLGACGSTPSSAGHASTSTTSALTTLQEGLSFYKGKTITFVSPDKPGGGFDEYARDYAPYLGSYLHANVVVTNIPAGNTVSGQNAVAEAKPNGLTVGWLNAGPDIEDVVLGLPGLSFDPLKEVLLGGTAPGVDAVASSTSASCSTWSSWAAVVKDSSASQPVTEVIQTTGLTTFILVLANGVFGVHARTIPGYASSTDLLQGFERGDGCVLIDPVSNIGPLVEGGKARPLLTNVALQPSNADAAQFARTPTIAEAEQQFKTTIRTALQGAGIAALEGAATSARGFFTAAGTPGPQTAALKAAFMMASKSAQLRAQLIKQGNPTGYQTPAFVTESYSKFLQAADKVGPYLAPIKSGG